MGSVHVEGSNAWVGVKGAGSLDLRSESHCLYAVLLTQQFPLDKEK